MTLISYGEAVNQILNGATKDKVNLHNGYYLCEAVGYAKITTTPQTNIPVFLPSQAQAGGELVTNPDQRLILPSGAIVNRVGLRLPQQDDLKISQTTQYGNLQPKATLIGVTGEKLKVNTTGTFTGTGTTITCVASIYSPNASATVNRALTGVDVPTAMIQTYNAPTPVALLCSNAGDSAAGTGISTSAGDAFVIVQVCWLEIQPALGYEILGYQSRQKGN